MKLVDEKKRLVTDLIDSIHVSLLGKVDQVPEEWDGHELRQWIADTFADQCGGTLMNKRCKRYQDFKNAVLTRNL